MPRIGDMAPDFDAVTTIGHLKFSEYNKGSWVILFSHPADFTPVCTTEMSGFATEKDFFAKHNTKLMGLSIDSIHAHIAWVNAVQEKTGVLFEFPIVADIDMKVAKLFGMLQPGESETAAVRAVFIIDPQGKVRLIIFLHHTSLYEFLYLGFLPNHFLRKLSKRMVAPAADKTLNRPLVGVFFKLFSPGMIPITRKRDDSWGNFLESIYDDSIILIAPEGRMKRKTGLDLDGKKMTVKPGVVDILAGLDKGQMVIAYSGGLHHVQVPDEGLPKLFKTNLKIKQQSVTTPQADFRKKVAPAVVKPSTN